MTGSMRIVLASSGNELALLHEVCASAGHDPVAYAYSRSDRDRQPTRTRCGPWANCSARYRPAWVCCFPAIRPDSPPWPATRPTCS